MGTEEKSDTGNPFTRFAFASAGSRSRSNADAAIKEERKAPTPSSVKRARSQEKDASRCRSSKLPRLVQVDSKWTTDATTSAVAADGRLQLLQQLFEAREHMITPIDEFGTQVCVASGVATAKAERFQLLVAALLSSQTQDPITYAAMQRLHQLGEGGGGLTSEAVLATKEERLDELLQPVGFHRRKAQQLKRVASILRNRHHDDVPTGLDELLALPGIGPKIARVILLLAWGKVDGIVVDTHVHRLAQRLGWAGATMDPESTRRELEDWIPRELWGKLSLAVVGFGQAVCAARNPSCTSCPLAAECPSAFKIQPATRMKMKKPPARLEKEQQRGKSNSE